MKRIVVAGDMPFLPEEIIRNILARLPAKTLIRSRCVCKHWRNLIKTPSFISDHLHHFTHHNPSLLLQRNGLWHLDCKMQLHKVDMAPLIDSSNTFRIVGSSNGLLCVEVDTDSGFYPSLLLWNPATREVRQVAPNTKGADLPFRVGFGFSPVVNDYKIVITYESDGPDEILDVLVYSLSSASWKKVKSAITNVTLFYESFTLSYESVTVNGTMFWNGLGWNPDTNTYYFAIVSFDIANEVFTLIPKPDWCASTSMLTIYENRLAVLSSFASQKPESVIQLWVTEDGSGASWAKKYSSCLIPGVVRPVSIWMNQIVCDGSENEHQECDHEQKITLLNISTNELKAFNISKCGGGNGSGFIYDHAESLVPTGGKKLCTIFV